MAGIRNELRWSKSRGGVFHECLRKYFLRYYHSWEGWKASAPEPVRKAYILSKMMSMATLAGQAVHRSIARHLNGLKRGQTLPLDPEGAVGWMRRVWKDTAGQLYLKNPKRHPPLLEVYYDQRPSPERRQEYAARVRNCLANFEASALYRSILQSGPESWVWIDRDDDQFEARTIFQVDWDEAFGSPDFVRTVEGRIEIYDWKTGIDTPEDEVQVTVYGAWAVEQLQARPDAIDGRLVYLNDGARVEPVRISPHDIDHVRSLILDELAEMKTKLVDAQTNTPHPMTEFPMTDDRVLCRRCEYQEMCFPEGVPDD